MHAIYMHYIDDEALEDRLQTNLYGTGYLYVYVAFKRLWLLEKEKAKSLFYGGSEKMV